MDKSWTAVQPPATRATLGNQSEVDRLVAGWPGLVEELGHLVDLANSVLNRKWTGNNQDDLVIFALGHQILECFEDILLLAGNGRGFGAQKLLRAMYEHLVTAMYIHQNPTQAEPFMKYEHLRNERLVPQIIGVMEESAEKAALQAKLPALKAEADAVRALFIRPCKCHPTCTYNQPATSWSALGMARLARETGFVSDLLMSYYLPITETHPTFSGAISRITGQADGSASFGNATATSRLNGYRALASGWKHALQGLQLQVDHFPDLAHLQSNLDERIARCNEIVKKDPTESDTGQ